MQRDEDRSGGIASRFAQWRDDERGAVAMLALVGILIVLMVGLVLYDAGFMARENVDNQMGADTAAYSQAAVKARAMNNIAFANVAKRTIAGIRNMYWGNFLKYLAWWASQCGSCCCWDLTACLNCIGNIPTVFTDLQDWLDMMGDDDMMDYLETLDSYQENMIDYVGYWALAEGAIRGARNGADWIGTYPMPDNDEYGGIPVERSSNKMEACLFWPEAPMTLTTMYEWMANYQDLEDRSDSAPTVAEEGPAEQVNPAMSVIGCLVMNNLAGEKQAPMYLSAPGFEDGTDLLERSNFVFAYRENEALEGEPSEKYDYLEHDYGDVRMADGYLDGKPVGGIWSMARGEVHFPESKKPSTLTDGTHGIWMFHPGWLGKLRPVMLPGERFPSSVEPADMWEEASETFTGYFPAALGADPMNMVERLKDDKFMESAMEGFEGEDDGKEMMDGLPK